MKAFLHAIIIILGVLGFHIAIHMLVNKVGGFEEPFDSARVYQSLTCGLLIYVLFLRDEIIKLKKGK